MSNLPQDWEAEIRQKVNKHEFSYDPAAWGEMSALLEQTTAAASNPGHKAGQNGHTVLNRWMFIAVAILVTIALLFWNHQKNARSPKIESWSVPVAPPEEAIDASFSTPKNQMPIKIAERARDVFVDPTPSILPEELTMEVEEEIFPSRKDQGLCLPLPMPPLPKALKSLQPEVKTDLPEIRLPSSSRRKRDRKTLFPDVIEND